MNWKLIPKDKAKQPAGNDYTKWKEQIAAECFNQCVYCAIHEQPWGGIDNYHIEHYKPKSIFPNLELDICNLYYACPICNRFKSNDWPADPAVDLSNISYPDPSKTDYSTIFAPDDSNFTISGRNTAANYVVERLFLNRPQLIYERRERMLKQEEARLRSEVVTLAFQLGDNELLKETLGIVDRLMTHLHSRQNVRPYKQSEIRRN